MMEQIQLSSLPNQTFQSTISVDGNNITLQFFVRYNSIAGYWTMRITDPLTNTILIDSLPLVTGDGLAQNLLAQYSYLKIGSAYLINIDNVDPDPTSENLGVNFVLLWGDTA